MRLFAVLVLGFGVSMSVIPLGGCAASGEDLRSPGRIRADSDRAFRLGDYPLALEGYRKVLDARPGSAQAQYDVGRTRLALGEAVAAREHLTVAYDIEPENAVYLDALVDAMVETGELDAVLELLERRAEEGDGVEGYLRLGRVSRDRGLFDEAEGAFLKAVALAPDGSERAQRALADLYRRAGDRTKELERLRVLLFLSPEDESVRERISELGEVPGPSFALRPEQVDA